MQNLEFDIVAMDTESGIPTEAIATVKLVKFDRSLFEEGYDGLIMPGTEDVSKSIGSLDEWNMKILSGGGKAGSFYETISPKFDLFKRPYKARTKPEEK